MSISKKNKFELNGVNSNINLSRKFLMVHILYYFVIFILLFTSLRALAENSVRKIAPESFPNYGSRGDGKPALNLIPATTEQPTGNCRREDRGWSLCLNRLVELMDQLVQLQVDAAVLRLTQRQDVGEGKRGLWIRNLNMTQSHWRALRDEECGFLSTAENGIYKEYFEFRAICSITQSVRRIEDIKRRFM